MAPPTLLTLPAELRNTIWELAVTKPSKPLLIPACRTPAITRVNHQTRRESRGMFFALNTFRFHSDIDNNVRISLGGSAQRFGRGRTVRRPILHLIHWLSAMGLDACADIKRIEICVQERLHTYRIVRYRSLAPFVLLGWWPHCFMLDESAIQIRYAHSYSNSSGRRGRPYAELEVLKRRVQDNVASGRKARTDMIKGPILYRLSEMYSADELLQGDGKRMLWLGIIDFMEPFDHFMESFDHFMESVMGMKAIEFRRIPGIFGGLFGELAAGFTALLCATLYCVYQEEEPFSSRFKVAAYLTAIVTLVIWVVGIWCGQIGWRFH